MSWEDLDNIKRILADLKTAKRISQRDLIIALEILLRNAKDEAYDRLD